MLVQTIVSRVLAPARGAGLATRLLRGLTRTCSPYLVARTPVYPSTMFVLQDRIASWEAAWHAARGVLRTSVRIFILLFRHLVVLELVHRQVDCPW